LLEAGDYDLGNLVAALNQQLVALLMFVSGPTIQAERLANYLRHRDLKVFGQPRDQPIHRIVELDVEPGHPSHFAGPPLLDRLIPWNLTRTAMATPYAKRTSFVQRRREIGAIGTADSLHRKHLWDTIWHAGGVGICTPYNHQGGKPVVGPSNEDAADLEVGSPNKVEELPWRTPSVPWIRCTAFGTATALLAGVLGLGAWGAITGRAGVVAWSESNSAWAWIFEYMAAAYYFGGKLVATVFTKAWAALAGSVHG
jgi:hypothetical protein